MFCVRFFTNEFVQGCTSNTLHNNTTPAFIFKSLFLVHGFIFYLTVQTVSPVNFLSLPDLRNLFHFFVNISLPALHLHFIILTLWICCISCSFSFLTTHGHFSSLFWSCLTIWSLWVPEFEKVVKIRVLFLFVLFFFPAVKPA